MPKGDTGLRQLISIIIVQCGALAKVTEASTIIITSPT